MVYLIIFVFLIVDGVIVPFAMTLNHFKLKLFTLIQHNFTIIYFHAPNFVQNWLHAQLKVIPIFLVLLIISLLQRSRLSKQFRNLSDKHGIRGTARWANKHEIMKWWWN